MTRTTQHLSSLKSSLKTTNASRHHTALKAARQAGLRNVAIEKLKPDSMDLDVKLPNFSGDFKLFAISDVMSGYQLRYHLPAYEDIFDILVDDTDHLATCSFHHPGHLIPGAMRTILAECKDAPGEPVAEAILDPFDMEPYTLTISSITPHDSLAFTPDELDTFEVSSNPRTGPVAPGLVAKLQLAAHDKPDIYSGSGYMKFIQTFSEEDEDGKRMEIFDVYFQLDLEVNPWAYRRAAGKHKSIHRHELAFWALRSSTYGVVSESMQDDSGLDCDHVKAGCKRRRV